MKLKEGWNEEGKLSIYVEDGKVIRGMFDNKVTIYPYRSNLKHGGWDLVSGITTRDYHRYDRLERISWK